MSSSLPPIPITLLTGFLGSGKTTLILSLLPQLLARNPSYRLALLKNEFGDLAIDSQLASSSSISGVREMLNGCICCNLVGQLGPALEELRAQPGGVDRIVVETSGSAFPATLAMEVNRLSTQGAGYILDGVVTVIDVENWAGYEDTSYTAKLQARYTDLIVLNKWEDVGERRLDEVLDRVGDLDTGVAVVKSRRGEVDVDLVFGIDGGLAQGLKIDSQEDDGHEHGHAHQNSGTAGAHSDKKKKSHQSEVEVLSITLQSNDPSAKINSSKLEKLLRNAPKDEVYRIKAVLAPSSPIPSSDGSPSSSSAAPSTTTSSPSQPSESARWILNWAFGRWTSTALKLPSSTAREHESSDGVVLRMTMILARFESKKWKKRIEGGGYLELDGGAEGTLSVEKIG